jgi:hypothetical protein
MAVSVRESRTLNTRRPFSRADARKAGIALRELLSPRFHKIFYDCYVASTISHHHRAARGGCIRHLSTRLLRESLQCSQLWGAIVPEVSDVHVTVPGDAGRTVRRGVKAHVAADGTATTRIRTLPITTPVQTYLDLAAAGLIWWPSLCSETA